MGKSSDTLTNAILFLVQEMFIERIFFISQLSRLILCLVTRYPIIAQVIIEKEILQC